MDLKQYQPNFDKTIDHLKHDLASIRTNRATPAMLENIQVNVYGSKMPINQLANIQSPEPQMLIVEPWDRTITKDVENAIQGASMGLSVTNEGSFLRITVSPMTDQTRKELIKILNGKLENCRNSIRGTRDDIKDQIIKAEKNKDLSEDDKFKLIEALDKMTRDYNDKVKDIGEKKEGEIKF